MPKLRTRLAATAIAGFALAACAWTAPATAAPVTTSSGSTAAVTTAPAATTEVRANCAIDTWVRSRPDHATDDRIILCHKSTTVRVACWVFGAEGDVYYAIATGIPLQETGYVNSLFVNNVTGSVTQC